MNDEPHRNDWINVEITDSTPETVRLMSARVAICANPEDGDTITLLDGTVWTFRRRQNWLVRLWRKLSGEKRIDIIADPRQTAANIAAAINADVTFTHDDVSKNAVDQR